MAGFAQVITALIGVYDQWRYDEISSQLDQIIADGDEKDKYVLESLDSKELPVVSEHGTFFQKVGSFLGFSTRYQGKKESDGDYVTRSLELFDLYSNDDYSEVIASKGDLNLHYSVVKTFETDEDVHQVLFKPIVYHDLGTIEADIPTHIYGTVLDYSHYSFGKEERTGHKPTENPDIVEVS